MSDATISTSQIWDAALGADVTQTTLKNLISNGWPTIPTGAYDISQSQEDGEYIISYKVAGSPTSGCNLEIQCVCSTEPLITHPIFQSGGTYALSNSDLSNIGKAEGDPQQQATYAASPTTSIGAYFFFITLGIDSYLSPQITMRATKIEDTIPNFSDVGKVVTTPPDGSPSLAGSADWLLVGIDSKSIAANSWRSSYEYRASALRGWSSTLYSSSGATGTGFGS